MVNDGNNMHGSQVRSSKFSLWHYNPAKEFTMSARTQQSKYSIEFIKLITQTCFWTPAILVHVVHSEHREVECKVGQILYMC